MRTVKRLAVAQRAHELTLQLYSITSSFPSEERYGLTSQLRRASAAVGCNISEGDASNSNAEFARYLDIAIASGGEVAYQLLLARDLGYLTEEDYLTFANEADAIRSMLIPLARSVRSRPRVKGLPDQ